MSATLDEIFSYGGRWGTLSESDMEHIQLALKKRWATAHVVDLPKLNRSDPIRFQFEQTSGGHMDLCAQAARWLETQGKEWSGEWRDLGYAGCVADVAAKDKTIFVECGYTKAGNILRALANKLTVLVIPYGTPENEGYLFQPVNAEAIMKLIMPPDHSNMIARRLGL